MHTSESTLHKARMKQDNQKEEDYDAVTSTKTAYPVQALKHVLKASGLLHFCLKFRLKLSSHIT